MAARTRGLTGGRGADAAFECAGVDAVLDTLLDAVRPAGVVVNVSIWGHRPAVDMQKIVLKEIDLRGARTSAGEFPEALELIASKKVDMLKLLTKTVTLEEVPETIIDIEKNPGNYMKVVVTME